MRRIIFLLTFFILTIFSLAQEKPELVIPSGHADRIKSIDISPDGKQIASAAYDNSVKVWNVATGTEWFTLVRGNFRFNSVLYSKDGSRIFAGDADGNLFAWKSSDFSQINKVSTGRQIFDMALSPDGKTIALAQWKTIDFYDSQSLQKISSISASGNLPLALDVKAISYAPDGKTIYSSSADDKLRIFSLPSGNITKTLYFGSSDITDISSSPDGKIIAFQCGFSDDSVVIYDIKQLKIKFILQGSKRKINSFAFSPDGKILAAGGSNYELYLWNTETGALIQKKEAHIDAIECCRFSTDGNYIVTSSDDKSILVWKTSPLKPLRRFKTHARRFQKLAFSHDNSCIIGGSISTNNTLNNNLILWDISGTKGAIPFFSKAEIPDVNALAISDDNRTVASASDFDNNRIRLFDLKELKQKSVIEQRGDRVTPKCMYFALRDSLLIVGGDDDYILGYNLITNKLINKYEGHTNDVIQTVATSDGKWMASISEDNSLKIWNIRSKSVIKSYNPHESGDIECMSISQNGKMLSTGAKFGIAKVWEIPSGNLLKSFSAARSHSVTAACFASKDKILCSGGFDSDIILYDINTSTEKGKLKGHKLGINSMSASFDGKLLASSSMDNSVKIWDINNKNEIATLVYLDSLDWVMVTPDNYYFCSRDASANMAFRKNGIIYPFEQFDLQYNRPDIILERLGHSSPDLIKILHKAWLKRLKKMNFDQGMFSPDFHMPELEIKTAEIPALANDSILNIYVEARDDKYNIDRINVWVNEVPVYGAKGMTLIDTLRQTILKNISVHLSYGTNKVQISTMNEKGVESLRKVFEIAYEPETYPKPDIYIISMSVSQYQDSRFDLKYSVKDGADIAALFKGQQENFSHVFSYELFNEKAVKEKFFSLKEVLKKSKVDDQVVVFISGHGLLDDSLDFYFATWDVDFDKPAARGIRYDELESLLDNIPARHKLLLIDACHSGEVDKEQQVVTDSMQILADGSRGVVKSYQYKGIKVGNASEQISLTNSFELMNELFANLDRGTGTLVISAASGMGLALESAEWNNGVFTYSVIHGIRDKEADLDRNGSISVRELKTYVFHQVETLTGGFQKPTSRSGSIKNDWLLVY
jgi:WD40 repeat protein